MMFSFHCVYPCDQVLMLQIQVTLELEEYCHIRQTAVKNAVDDPNVGVVTEHLPLHPEHHALERF